MPGRVQNVAGNVAQLDIRVDVGQAERRGRGRHNDGRRRRDKHWPLNDHGTAIDDYAIAIPIEPLAATIPIGMAAIIPAMVIAAHLHAHIGRHRATIIAIPPAGARATRAAAEAIGTGDGGHGR